MKIRRATRKDAATILDVARQTPELSGVDGEDSLYTLDFVLGSITDREMCLVLVAEEDGKLLGFIIAEIWKRRGISYLDNIVVVLGQRGRGIGRALYESYEMRCRKLGVRHVAAHVLVTNRGMQRFFDKSGFERGHMMYYQEKDISGS